jgi:hypothetical protein
MLNNFDDLRAKYPRLIQPDFGFECGVGWLDILDRYFAEVDALLPADVEWSNRQIKEKFGTLRLYCEPLWPGKEPTALFAIDILNVGLSHRPEGDDGEYAEIDKKLARARYLAEGRSGHTCERCGKRGVLRQEHGWHFTACEEHAKDGEPVIGEAVLTFGDKRYRFDPDLDDLVEIEGEADDH